MRRLTLALEQPQQRDRVCRIRLWMPGLGLQKLLMAIDGEYPVLEYMIMGAQTEAGTALMLPETLQAHAYVTSCCLGSNRISITYKCCGPRHTLAFHSTPIHLFLFPATCSDPMVFIHASAGDACDRLCTPYFKP
jgi:hypothetical protein